MIMFDYLTTMGVKHPKKWLYNMEAAPKGYCGQILNLQDNLNVCG